MKKVIINCILVIILLILICIVCYGELNSIQNELIYIAIGFFFGHLLDEFIDFLQDLDIVFQIQCWLNRNENIRISFAYLFRIQVDGTYFLVKGNKLPRFQPVGGVFQKYAGANSVLKDIFQEDDEMKKGNENDLRGRVFGKDLKKFIVWFNSREDREITCDREFYEELIKTGILKQKNFQPLAYSYVGTHKTNIFSSTNYGKEFLLAEIYDLQLNDKQKQEFLKLKEVYDNSKDNSKLQYAFVTEEEIRTRITKKRQDNNYDLDISNHTIKILKGEHKR